MRVGPVQTVRRIGRWKRPCRWCRQPFKDGDKYVYENTTVWYNYHYPECAMAYMSRRSVESGRGCWWPRVES